MLLVVVQGADHDMDVALQETEQVILVLYLAHPPPPPIPTHRLPHYFLLLFLVHTLTFIYNMFLI